MYPETGRDGLALRFTAWGCEVGYVHNMYRVGQLYCIVIAPGSILKGEYDERLYKSNRIVNDSDCGNVGMADQDGEQVA